jgi:hypothetical protein
MLTEQQLIAGELPSLEPEQPHYHISKEPIDDDHFDLRVTLDSGLSFADLLRHASHGLYLAGHTYATNREPFEDVVITHPKEPGFNGNLVLDLSTTDYCLNPQEKEAMDMLLEKACLYMTGRDVLKGQLWVDYGTEQQRNVQLHSLIPYQR